MESFSADEIAKREKNPRYLPIPLGYRFIPYDHELILKYLMIKIMGLELPCDIIKDIDFYDLDPQDFPTSDFKNGVRKNEAYYFTQTKSTKTCSKSGYWKACGKEREIKDGTVIVGFKTKFVFYLRNKVNGIEKQSSWVMHELRVNPDIVPTDQAQDDNIKTKIQHCVICRIKNKDMAVLE
ncbi:hypothetical protein PTKIN_Ptkin06aG0128600 [Pterospermum kingtungense]